MTAKQIEYKLQQLANPQKKTILSSFFKSGKGEYGEGDIFIGVTVPAQRSLVKSVKELDIKEIQTLLQSPFHECRMTALLFLVEKFKRAKIQDEQKLIYQFYINNSAHINNWDLVDLSAPTIVGGFLKNCSKTELYQLVQSSNIWLQRIAIVSTITFIREGKFDDTLELSKILLHHPHDLIQKAVGWMLREVGKRDFDMEYIFLAEAERYKTMPRTMLRYAIEKFPENIRKEFLLSKI